MRTAAIAAIVLAVLALAAAFAQAGRWPWAGLSLLAAVPWVTEPWHRQRWPISVGFLWLAVPISMAALAGISPVWLLTVVVLALIAWDLIEFGRHLEQVDREERGPEQVRIHLLRLGLVAGLGWILGLVAVQVRLTYSLAWVLVIGLLLIIGLSRSVRRLRREGDSNR